VRFQLRQQLLARWQKPISRERWPQPTPLRATKTAVRPLWQ
jgi:hypothetical protein